METVDTINERLRGVFGTFLNGMPRYRLVWSSSQREKRYGTYDVCAGSIYLRTETGVMDVEKYPFYKDKWILEKCFGNDSKEIVDCQYTYEPVFVFRDKNNNPLPPLWRVCEILIQSIEGFLKTGKMSPKDYMAQEEAECAKEAEMFADMLGEDMRSPMFEDEAAVFMDSTKRRES
jgi:hypothetical protein